MAICLSIQALQTSLEALLRSPRAAYYGSPIKAELVTRIQALANRAFGKFMGGGQAVQLDWISSYDSLLLLVQVLRDAGLVLEIAGWRTRC